MEPAGTDLTYDLRWFLYDGHLFKPTPERPLDDERNALKASVRCLVENLEGQSSSHVRSLRDNVRSKMKSMGFYTGNKSTRPEAKFLEDNVIGPREKIIVSDKGEPVNVYVYTDPTPPGAKSKVTEHDCTAFSKEEKKKRGIDCVHCVARHEAQKQAKERTSRRSIVIAMTLEEDVSQFWQKLDAQTKNRLIAELHIFGHGAPNYIQIGGSGIDVNEKPPSQLWCRFAKGAGIVLYGCNVVSEGERLSADTLVNWFGKGLLCRGGTVTAFNAEVNSGCNGPNGLTLHIVKENKKPKFFEGCNPDALMKEFLRVLDDWVNHGEKVT